MKTSPQLAAARRLAHRLAITARVAVCFAALTAAGATHAQQGAPGAYPVSELVIEYALEDPERLAPSELRELEVGLRRTEGGFVAPRPLDRTDRVGLSTLPPDSRFYPSALRHIRWYLALSLRRRGYEDVFVATPDIDRETGRDLRRAGDTRLRLVIWTGGPGEPVLVFLRCAKLPERSPPAPDCPHPDEGGPQAPEGAAVAADRDAARAYRRLLGDGPEPERTQRAFARGVARYRQQGPESEVDGAALYRYLAASPRDAEALEALTGLAGLVAWINGAALRDEAARSLRHALVRTFLERSRAPGLSADELKRAVDAALARS